MRVPYPRLLWSLWFFQISHYSQKSPFSTKTHHRTVTSSQLPNLSRQNLDMASSALSPISPSQVMITTHWLKSVSWFTYVPINIVFGFKRIPSCALARARCSLRRKLFWRSPWRASSRERERGWESRARRVFRRTTECRIWVRGSSWTCFFSVPSRFPLPECWFPMPLSLPHPGLSIVTYLATSETRKKVVFWLINSNSVKNFNI